MRCSPRQQPGDSTWASGSGCQPEQRTPGPTGLSVFADEAELSVRDLALMMMAVSDNAATDILIGLAGLDSINATLASLGPARHGHPRYRAG